MYGGVIVRVIVFSFQEKIEDTKGVIKNRKSKKDRQCNGQERKGQKDKQ
jgi:hypothetical protein